MYDAGSICDLFLSEGADGQRRIVTIASWSEGVERDDAPDDKNKVSRKEQVSGPRGEGPAVEMNYHNEDGTISRRATIGPRQETTVRIFLHKPVIEL